MDEEQLYNELEQLVEDYVRGIISDQEYEELQRRIQEDLKDLE